MGRQVLSFYTAASALVLWNQHFKPASHFWSHISHIYLLICLFFNMLSKSPVQFLWPPSLLFSLIFLHCNGVAVCAGDYVCVWARKCARARVCVYVLSHTSQHQMSNLHFSLVWMEGRRKRNKRTLVWWPPSRRKRLEIRIVHWRVRMIVPGSHLFSHIISMWHREI